MSVELRLTVQGHCECGVPHNIGEYQSQCVHDVGCDWGVIQYSDPRPALGQVGHLMLATGWWVGAMLNKGPRRDDRYGQTSVTEQDGRLFIHMDWEDQHWTWELFKAHFSDGKGPDDLFIGRWPD